MSSDLAVHHDPVTHQFAVEIQGLRAYLVYMDLGKRTLDFYRTFVPEALRGKGVAATLVGAALDYAKREGYMVIPSCSYVERYLHRSAQKNAQ